MTSAKHQQQNADLKQLSTYFRAVVPKRQLRLRRDQQERYQRDWEMRQKRREQERAEQMASAQKAAREAALRAAHSDAARERDLNMAGRARALAAGGGIGSGRRPGEVANPAASLAEILRAQQQQKRAHQSSQAPPLVSFLPEGLNASSPNVTTVHDTRGRILGYQVWSSKAEMVMAIRTAAAAEAGEEGRMRLSSNGGGGGGAAGGGMQAAPHVGAGGVAGVGSTAAGPGAGVGAGVGARIMNGGSLSRNGGGAAAAGVGRVAVAMPVPVSCISTAEAAAASDDGIMLRHVSVGVSLRGVVWMVVVVVVVVVVAAARCCCFFGLVRVF